MRRFTQEYAARYGQGALVSGAPVEIVAMRAIGTGRTVRAQLDQRPAEARGTPAASGTRRIHQGPHHAPVEATVVRGADIRPGHTLTGPAIVDAADTTIWIPAGATARIDGFGTLRPGAHMTAISREGRLDAVTLEVLRSRLQATAEEGAITIERTAISPVIAESRDYSCTLLEANGDLIVAGGAITHHFGVCGHAVRATLAKFGDTIAPGDMFFANDPHNGGGLHAQDVLVQLPVFAGDRLIAWVVNSGHMLDMGGLTFGSWSPEAIDCYQEALRLPPVRLFRAGKEQSDVWDIIRNNVRVPDIVEMDCAAWSPAATWPATSSPAWPGPWGPSTSCAA